MGRRLPANASHMRAISCAAVGASRGGLVLLQTGLEDRWWPITGRMRCRTHSGVPCRCGGRRASDTHVDWDRTALLEILEVLSVTNKTVAGKIHARRH